MPQSKSRKIAILGYRSVAFTKLITVNGQEYHLQLVDTAGQDEYSIFPQTYSIDINGYILVYSVTSIKSFEVIKVIHGKLLDMVGKVQIPIMLVGNKKDLHMERVISYEEGKALAESWNAAFLESSAKENQPCRCSFKRHIRGRMSLLFQKASRISFSLFLRGINLDQERPSLSPASMSSHQCISVCCHSPSEATNQMMSPSTNTASGLPIICRANPKALSMMLSAGCDSNFSGSFFHCIPVLFSRTKFLPLN
ncbi:GTP-binding protein Rheb isoform X2 [Lagenorhynchus albirostris]|uniref:GTP-binding protein Rheb isoform X2 n=1 Tax=Lagenorhynchus albirostris TaxID=27610 RepID=UPI0028EFCD23|nr:GTP-binding protein Rheb isoform X2 [Lagenorhynchus albirostris]